MKSRAASALLFLVLFGASGCATTPPVDRASVVEQESMEHVLKRTFTAPGFTLESGQTLSEMTLAYETYGRLASDGRNAILITHGFTSNQL